MPVKEVRETDKFKKIYKKLDNSLKIKLNKILIKIIENPDIGKPMMYTRKGTRELYLKPFRISYFFEKSALILYFLDIYHKDEQ